MLHLRCAKGQITEAEQAAIAEKEEVLRQMQAEVEQHERRQLAKQQQEQQRWERRQSAEVEYQFGSPQGQTSSQASFATTEHSTGDYTSVVSATLTVDGSALVTPPTHQHQYQ